MTNETAGSSCRCPRIRVGLELSEARSWNHECAEHGAGSAWWNSDGERARRSVASARLRELQDLARAARRARDAGDAALLGAIQRQAKET